MPNATGLRCLYGVVAALAVGLSAQRANAQDEAPLPATPTPPPDFQEREKMSKPPANPGRSPEVDELLQKIHLTRADIDKRKADKNERQLPATADEPPDVQERKKIEKAPPAPPRSPDVDELLEKVKKQPGGAEKLERARRAGARIPPGKSEGASREVSPVRMAGPRMDGPVFDPSPAETQLPTLKVTRSAFYQNVAGLGILWAYDYFPYNGTTGTMWGPLFQFAGNTGAVGNVDIRPYISAYVDVTNPGWYLLNFVASKGKASLRKHGPASGTPPMYDLLSRWDNSASANQYESYPFVMNLAAGYHYFYFAPDLNNWMYVTEVSLIKF